MLRTPTRLAVATMAIAAAVIVGLVAGALSSPAASARAAVSPAATSTTQATPARAVRSRRRRHSQPHLHCFASPRSCGFPDPAAHYPAAGSVGPHNGKKSVPCGSLRRSGSLTVSQAGHTVKNLNVVGRIEVVAPNVTIKNVCVTYDGRGNIGSPAAVQFSAGGGTISYSNISGANTTNESVEVALGANGRGAYQIHADHDYLHGCGECIHDDGWTLTNSYVITNGDPCSDGYSGSSCEGEPDHREAIYCNSGSFTGVHDTLLNPFDQTAAVFCDTNLGGGGACTNQVTVQNSLLAGGGYVIYACGNASSAGTSHTTITGNDFARCGTKTTYQPSTGGRTCGPKNAPSTNGKGYWPLGGYFGVDDDTSCSSQGGGNWSGNYWDDNGAKVPC